MARAFFVMGNYIDRDNLVNRVGAANLAKWSSLSGDDASENEAVITDAISEAEGYIDDFLRKGRYVVPLSGTGSDALRTVKGIAVDLAIWNLYSARGILAGDGRADRMRVRMEDAEQRLRDIAGGKLILDASRTTTGPTAPFVVEAVR